GAPPREPPRALEPPRAAEPAAKVAKAADEDILACPRCKTGTLITGKRGWGCSRWREGCQFVIWFETAGKRLTKTQLEELVTKGKTRKAKFSPEGAPVPGRLVLDLETKAGGAKFVADP